MARLREFAASCWAGVSCARVSWARMLFSARVDGIGPSLSSADFFPRHSLKVGNVPLDGREWVKSTFPTGSNSGLVGGSIPLKMGSFGRDWSRI